MVQRTTVRKRRTTGGRRRTKSLKSRITGFFTRTRKAIVASLAASGLFFMMSDSNLSFSIPSSLSGGIPEVIDQQVLPCFEDYLPPALYRWIEDWLYAHFEFDGSGGGKDAYPTDLYED